MARDHPYTAQCEKCSAHISATFRPSMLHHYSAVLGYLDLSAAVPVDLVLQDCELVVGCLSCSKEEPLQNVLYGQNKEFNCLHCHSKLSILVETTRFQYLQPRSRNERGDKGSLQQRPKFYRDPAVQPGKPLPQKGTCRHYKQSYRWLRFPCCGRAYPCDTCHDEDQNHEMELATRMICGYCAKEQLLQGGAIAGDKGSLQQRPKFYRDPAVQPGKPLPQKGTCRHYKQSYRWLRFPCCGRAYPCDACHDEDQNHEMELATRMICGYCAKEQVMVNYFNFVRICLSVEEHIGYDLPWALKHLTRFGLY
ncbi:hypothetical protein EOD39_17281 [Acipenser ruthenus]|uniref:CHY-type domain-containing protein n=1 Tax=Acipenser ruthenus TaxID=7906 RepID=A0A444V3U5_ACIRT|nr:hypothetical protein EOD39_17281 [Acipenser ruthenus]